MDLGLLGLPNVGKSTLFNLLTDCGAAVGPYPFTTVEPNQATLSVPDERLEKLAAVVGAHEVRPARLRVVDIAGLVEGASAGLGLGNRFLAHVREADALLYVLRCFADENVARAGTKEAAGGLDPVGELDVLVTELALADLATVTKRRGKVVAAAKGHKGAPADLATLDKLAAALDAATPVRSLTLDENERALVAELFLLTTKPALYVASCGQPGNAAEEKAFAALKSRGERDATPVLAAYCKLECELAALPAEDERVMRDDFGLPAASSREDLLKAGAALLDLITFYAVEGGIASAWRIGRGATVREGAAKIHTDLAEHFIRADVVAADELVAAGGLKEARGHGLVRAEGPAYVLRDGDVVTVKHGA